MRSGRTTGGKVKKNKKTFLLSEDDALRMANRLQLPVCIVDRENNHRYSRAYSNGNYYGTYTILCVDEHGENTLRGRRENEEQQHGHWVKLKRPPPTEEILYEWLEKYVKTSLMGRKKGSLVNLEIKENCTMSRSFEEEMLEKRVIVYAYDLETYSNEDVALGIYGEQKVYAACWQEVVFLRKVDEFDLESSVEFVTNELTDSNGIWGGPVVLPSNVMECCVLGVDGVDDVIDEMMSRILFRHDSGLLKKCHDKNIKFVKSPRIVMFAHNGARFDTQFVYQSKFIDRETTKDGWRVLDTSEGDLCLSARVKVPSSVCKYSYADVEFRDSRLSIGGGSLKTLGNDFKIPEKFKKKSYDISAVTKENYLNKRDEWMPYLLLLWLAFY